MNKMVLKIIVLGIITFSSTIYSNNSQKRFPNESFQTALMRIKDSQVTKKFSSTFNSPEKTKVPVTKIDLSAVPKISSYDELMNMFYVIRDSRFLYLDNNPQFSRRISWLYPDDGCFVRAALAGIKLKENESIHPAKIFVFGELELQSPYALRGTVYWWYHVAEIVNYLDSYYVLDPALENQKPLLLEDWLHKMGRDEDLDGAICHAYTYGPLDDCFEPNEEAINDAQSDQRIYLKHEWKRMINLGFDPVLILGDNPPWLNW